MEPSKNILAVHCGSIKDEHQLLEKKCRKEADKLLDVINLTFKESIEIPFWTEDKPELICVGIFYKNNIGHVSYRLDYSQSTL